MTRSRKAASKWPVPVAEKTPAPELAQWLRSDPAQELMQGRIDFVVLKAVASYVGKALLIPGLDLKGVRLSATTDHSRSELVYVLCHELAHHRVGLDEHHSDRWREACASLVYVAGMHGLLTDERVEQGTEMALNGTATVFRGWPERAEQRQREREREAAEALAHLRSTGLQVGARVSFTYRGTPSAGEVIRINRYTITVREIGNEHVHVRVPFQRVEGIAVDPAGSAP